jgi:hypothetical protein
MYDGKGIVFEEGSMDLREMIPGIVLCSNRAAAAEKGGRYP